MKKEFAVDARVQFVRLGNDPLEGEFGTVLGKSFVNITDHYIVLLDNPRPDFKAICITEHCLELANG